VVNELTNFKGEVFAGGKIGPKPCRVDNFAESTMNTADLSSDSEFGILLSISREHPIRGIFAASDKIELFNMPALGGPLHGARGRVTVLAARENGIEDVSLRWQDGTLVCSTSEPEVAVSRGCDVVLTGEERSGSDSLVLFVKYEHILSGSFETSIHFRVWFPEEVFVVNPWVGAGADSGDAIGYQTKLTLNPVDEWFKACDGSRLPAFQRARVQALAIFSLGPDDECQETWYR
jgi:hypothetical protein